MAAGKSDPAADVHTPALDAWTEMRRADARLRRVEAQLEVVDQAVASVRAVLAEEAAARRRLRSAHAASIEAETRREYAVLRERLDTVRADYDQLAGSLDDTIRRHADRRLDDAAFAREQRASSDALRARAAELARLDQLRLRFEVALGEGPKPSPAATPPLPQPIPEDPETPVAPATPAAATPALAGPPAPPPGSFDTPVIVASGARSGPAVPKRGARPILVAEAAPAPAPTPVDPADEPAAVLVEAHDASARASHRIRDGLQIGRSIDSQLRVLDPSVSRQHAAIAIRSGTYVLEDLRSQNGTFVNGERIRQRVLCDGDRINIGEAEFIFRADGAADIGDGPSDGA